MKKAWIVSALLAAGALVTGNTVAKAPDGVRTDGGKQHYIVVLKEAPLAIWHSKGNLLRKGAPEAAGSSKSVLTPAPGKLDVHSAQSRAYVERLDAEFDNFRSRAEESLGRELRPVFRYRNALNGFSVGLTAAEAEKLASLPQVKRVEVDRVSKPHTDAGPRWIGASSFWNGQAPLPATRGEGIVIAIIDTGIDPDHSSFGDPGEDGPGWDHVNPKGVQFGECLEPDFDCNDKLIGVQEFVTNLAFTEVDEEPNRGLDNSDSGHGTHVASIAAGNPLNVSINDIPRQMSGVAPNASISVYRVCYIGDPDDSEDDGCNESFTVAAVEQAIEDEVDVINYSVGSTTTLSPWLASSDTEAFLSARAAGIFVATSTGNLGPGAGTVNSPAHAPWITAVASGTHNRVFASSLVSLSGGDTLPPGDLIGTSLGGGTQVLNIVHGKEYGSALCGMGPPQGFVDCSNDSSVSSPFPPGTFNGEIVACERGIFGREEKGLNVRVGGAGGYILLNTDKEGASIVADLHCLPAVHLTDSDSDLLRVWLDSGSGHMGRITGFDDIAEIDAVGDEVDLQSSRGPAPPPVENILKPNVGAPGVRILGASNDETNPFAFLGGTSMASPHVAGAAALLLAANESWTPSMISSTLELTATREQAIDFDYSPATPFEFGAGRVSLYLAATSGVFMNETPLGFLNANPVLNGNPKDLNLPGLVDTNCQDNCSFTRTVTAIAPNLTWTATAVDFPANVNVEVTPAQFLLPGGGSQSLDIDIDLEGAGQTGRWVYGKIRLSAPGMPDAQMTVAVFASGGDLPEEWAISSDRNSGSQQFSLGELVFSPDLTLNGGGFRRAQTDSQLLPQDPTSGSPFDGGSGVFTVLHAVSEEALWIHAQTLESTAIDLDLYVGIDRNGDGRAQASELLCESTTEGDEELCDIFSPEPGTYWMLVQRWCGDGTHAPCGDMSLDEATLVSAVIDGDGNPGLSATGPGIVEAGESFQVRVAWDNVNAVPGEELLGAVGIGTDRENPNNVGVIPIRFTRTAIADPRTLPLADGATHGLAIPANGAHDRAFIDIPEGADTLMVSATGANADQNNGLGIDLVRMEFGSVFGEVPFAEDAPGGAPAASASGSGGNGPVAMLSGAQLQPGRWYTVVRNSNGTPSSVELRADVGYSGEPVQIRGGLWQPPAGTPRQGINQGLEYSPAGIARGMVWYTYREDNSPAWYLAADLVSEGNVWTADLLRFTNNGAEQQGVKVGKVIITMLGEEEMIFSYTLFGESGSEPMVPTAENSCPMIDGVPRSVIGLWFRGIDGLGGASVLYNAKGEHVQAHYVYDLFGNPRWLFAFLPEGNDLTLHQFSGFCAVCPQGMPTFEAAGVLTHGFTSEDIGSWTQNYMFMPPLSGNANRTEDISKITDDLVCE